MKILKIAREYFSLIILALSLIYLINVMCSPEYKIYSSFSTSNSTSQRETELYIVVHKARYNPILYQEIAQKHIQINGTPSKLTLKLYKSERNLKNGRTPYRTIIFDYNRDLEYILLNPI